MPNNILAIDQGTTNTKALVVDGDGRILARGAQPTPVSYPRPGWVEQDALDIWRCTQAAIDQCLSALPQPDLAAVAISNQRETALVWERASGRPLGPCVVWQCQRSAPFCNELQARGLAPLLQEITGLQVGPMFSAAKLRWLIESIPNGRARAAQGELCCGNIDAWLLWNLTGGQAHATDMSNAARTQLFNLRTLQWDAQALDIFGVPLPSLPGVAPSSHVFGVTVPCGCLAGDVPIAALIGDSHAALYAQGGFRPGSVKATYGTGSSLMTPTAAPVLSKSGLSTTIAWARGKPTYALEGNIYATGAAVQWLGDLLGLAPRSLLLQRNAGLADAGAEIERLARSVEDAAGVYFVPALVGLGAPHWQEAARGLICGLTPGVRAGHLARATLEAIAYQIRDVFDAMQAAAGAPLAALLADGGASRNDLLMQLQADMLGCPLLRSTSAEMSPLGAAFLAGLAVGVWRSEDEIERFIPPRDRFEPAMPAAQRATLYAGWQAALARAMLQPAGE